MLEENVGRTNFADFHKLSYKRTRNCAVKVASGKQAQGQAKEKVGNVRIPEAC